MRAERPGRRSGFALIAALLVGCAHDVVRHRSPLTPAVAEANPVVELRHDADIQLDSGYARRLARGSRWAAVGVSPGQVYKTVASVFTVKGAHVHEARLVLNGEELVGFYLVRSHPPEE